MFSRKKKFCNECGKKLIVVSHGTDYDMYTGMAKREWLETKCPSYGAYSKHYSSYEDYDTPILPIVFVAGFITIVLFIFVNGY